jgi:hypothetical protein
MTAWSAQGYHIQHWYQLIAETQIDLYQGDGERAYQRFVAGWPALRRSLLLQMQHTRIVAVHLRGRAALAGGLCATGNERATRLRLARECANRLRRGTGWGSAMAALLYAGIEKAEGDDSEAAAWIGRAIDETGAHELALFKAAAQMAAGVMGNDPGTAAAGETWMRGSGAKTPRSLARMLAPGIAPD